MECGKFSTSMTGDELIDWLRERGLHIEDCEKIREARFNGRSFIRLQSLDFKELGIVLGSRYLLEDLIEEARKDASNPANIKHTGKSKKAVVATQHTGGFTLKTLVSELERLVQWQMFGVYMDVESHILTMIEKDNVGDTGRQKTALFKYLISNKKKLGVSWESVCLALESFEGNLAENLRKKYCTDAYVSSDVEESSKTLDPTRLYSSDLQMIQDVTWDVRSKWKALGIELRIDAPTLESIETRSRGNPDDCFRILLDTWLCGDTPKPTITNLSEALKSRTVNYGYLASKLSATKRTV